MNRYYNPTPREYVSTHVDMPWEFLQGVAEQKQKGFDTAVAAGDAASSLLNFEVIPGDVKFKNELQKKYNDRILEAQNYVQQTGDFSTASRKLTGVVRDIAQDPYINNMKAAVPIWKEQQKEKSKLESEGEILDFNNKWDYMHSTVDPETGATRSYQQSLPYKARTIGKAFYDDVKDSIDAKVIETFGDRVKKVNGEWVSKKTGERLSNELLPIMSTALEEIIPRYPNYFRDRTTYEIKQGVSKQDTTPNWIDKMTKALAAEYGVNNVEYDYKYDEKDFYNWKKQQEEPVKPPPVQVIAVPNKNKSNTFDLSKVVETESIREPIIGSTKEKVTTYVKKYKNPTNLSEHQKELFVSYMATHNRDVGAKILQGTASQEDLKNAYTGFEQFYNASNLAMSSNDLAYPMEDAKDYHNAVFGVDKQDLTVSDLSTAAGYDKSTEIINLQTGEKTTLGKIQVTKKGDKINHVNVNTDYTPINSLTERARELKITSPDRFASAVSITDDEGNLYAMPKPTNRIKLSDVPINKLHNIKYKPNIPTAVTIPTKTKPNDKGQVFLENKTYYTVFIPLDDSGKPLSSSEYINRRKENLPVHGVTQVFKSKKAASGAMENPNEINKDLVIDFNTSEGNLDVNSNEYMFMQDPQQIYNALENINY